MVTFEKQERNPRMRLDELLGYQFQLTQQDVANKIQELEARNVNFQNTAWVKVQVDEQVDKRRTRIREWLSSGKELDKGDWSVLSAYLSGGASDYPDEWKKLHRTKDLQLVTDDMINKFLDEFADSVYEYYQDRAQGIKKALDFGVSKGAKEIFNQWSQVWNFIQSIAPATTDDNQLYEQVREKFPEFCTDIDEYIVFVRAMPWNGAAESLIFQKELVRRSRKSIQERLQKK